MNAVNASTGVWRDLLLLIEAGEVVPIVGRELLRVGGPDHPTHLYAWLAERVAGRLGVSFDPAEPMSDPLNTVACRYLTTHDDARPLYINVYEEAKQLTTLGIPDALLKLAEIDSFKLFVTTIFDNSLKAAIDQVRFNKLARTDTRAFAPEKSKDLPAPIAELELPVVFHLLGRMSPTNDYVVTEEDALEFVYWLQKSPPATLFSELFAKDLLVIGCRFPSWLVRSFIRLARKNRLSQAQRTVFVVDSGAREDRTLIDFLRTFRTRTEVFEGADPAEFVNDLHRGWMERRTPEPTPVAPSQNLPAPGAIFISYASEDRGVAEQVVQALEAAKLTAWFDVDQLMTGDRFMDHIQAGIRRSDLFVPLLSRHSLIRAERYFRREWEAAFEKASGLPASVQFIFPVAIDDVPYQHQELPSRFSDLSWFSIAKGLSDDFVNAVKARYKKNQGD
jgi:hypothetical protein